MMPHHGKAIDEEYSKKKKWESTKENKNEREEQRQWENILHLNSWP